MAISTNKDYIKASLAKFNVNDDDVEVILLESGLDGTAEVDVKACKLAIYNTLSMVIPMANVTEGGFTVQWNIEALKMWYNRLCTELGKPNMIKPTIRNRSNVW